VVFPEKFSTSEDYFLSRKYSPKSLKSSNTILDKIVVDSKRWGIWVWPNILLRISSIATIKNIGIV
jgi:hypothetical protein